MPRLVIDEREVEVPAGSTILDAARKLGIDIPTLCSLDGHPPQTSCMVCLVQVEGVGRLVPSCAAKVAEGMRVWSETEEVREARRAALELLLSDHLGDCMAPCQTSCPAQMNIPLMIRQIASGALDEAIKTVKERIALPAVLGRICPAPCEKACRRGRRDGALAVCLLKRYVADVDIESGNSYLPACTSPSGKKVAIVGAGPAGLAAACYLLQQGHACTVFDRCAEPGGMLRYGTPEARLPRSVLDAEISVIRKLGAEFRMETTIGDKPSLADLQNGFDAVFLAIGEIEGGGADTLPIETSTRGIQIESGTFETSSVGVFAGGSAVRPSRLAIRAVADGRGAAISIGQYLKGEAVDGAPREFSTHIGRLKEGEMETFMIGVSDADRISPSGGAGFSAEEARGEADRCLHCDCRKADNCRLRDWADAFAARAGRYKSPRRTFEQHVRHDEIIYEPGKCISCGICVQIATDAREPLGLAFIGSGFDVRVGVPFQEPLAEGLKRVASDCARACPTGALALKDPTTPGS
ncbi:MAG: 2Fe-2S iron-sulfur cluster-binding protein [Planctomycetia bacterium]|nr:2Fe-2S iron-sulfur cluster-binding protein [Planctomycetia bacterium]